MYESVEIFLQELDALKPVDNPSLHVTCNQPTMLQIFEEMDATIQLVKKALGANLHS
jgi:hypothetical protein